MSPGHRAGLVLMLLGLGVMTVTGTPLAAEAPYRMPPLWQALFDHPHNKIVHFPLVMTLLATFSLWWARRRPELEPVSFWMVWATAAFTLAAYFSGQAQARDYVDEPKAWLVDLHGRQGIVIGIGQALWVLSLLRDNTRRFSWVLGVVLSVIVLAAGFLGGLVAHGK